MTDQPAPQPAPVDAGLARATHALLLVWTGHPGDRRAVTVVSPAWWDGAGVWLAAQDAADALREQPACTVVLSAGDGPELVVRGTARVHGLHDPLGLALHGPAIAGAMSALALRQPAALRQVLPGLPRDVLVRVTARDAGTLRFPDRSDGVAPALPPEAPSDVRRAVAGVRRVLVFEPSRPGVTAAVWGGGMRLTGLGPVPGLCAVVAQAGEAGLVLEGMLDADGVLRPERAQWWLGAERGGAPVRAGVGTIVLPE